MKKPWFFLPMAFRIIVLFVLSYPKNNRRRSNPRQKKSEAQKVNQMIIKQSFFGYTGHFQKHYARNISGTLE
jgi:predicted membrane protein